MISGSEWMDVTTINKLQSFTSSGKTYLYLLISVLVSLAFILFVAAVTWTESLERAVVIRGQKVNATFSRK